ncbi:MAG TPA: hypothetical protein VHF25_03395 [Nitriliruptorales bacterium]|nr:hypothetical protein [Nitriliruptorales bacterium]
MSPPSSTDGLPVALHVAGPLAGSVRRWVEGHAGWQAVDAAGAALVPPRLVLLDVAAASAAGPDTATFHGLPAVLLVTAEDPPDSAARAGAAAAAVLRWPDDRARLPQIAASLTSPGRAPQGGQVLRIGGAAGGVGSTTVALALGGLAAWQGRRTVVVTHDGAPAGVVGRAVADGDLTGVPLWEAATPVAGVRGLRVVRPAVRPLLRPGDAALDPGGAHLVVHDVGVADDVDVLVLRRDRASLHALARTTAAVAVVIAVGPAGARALRVAAAGRRLVQLPLSERVARAGLACRVPAGLPGAWLRGLAPLLLGGRA